jgi:branched-subunit amino acid transport protein
MTDRELYVWVAIAGLAVVSVITRGFFLIPSRPWPLPPWLRDALKVAPLAALVAVVAPEIFMTQGEVITTWQDARWPAALVATAAYYLWRRDILLTIVIGMAVMLCLRLGLGW